MADLARRYKSTTKTARRAGTATATRQRSPNIDRVTVNKRKEADSFGCATMHPPRSIASSASDFLSYLLAATRPLLAVTNRLSRGKLCKNLRPRPSSSSSSEIPNREREKAASPQLSRFSIPTSYISTIVWFNVWLSIPFHKEKLGRQKKVLEERK